MLKRAPATATQPPRCMCERLRALRLLGIRHLRAYRGAYKTKKPLGRPAQGFENDIEDIVGALGFGVFDLTDIQSDDVIDRTKFISSPQLVPRHRGFDSLILV